MISWNYIYIVVWGHGISLFLNFCNPRYHVCTEWPLSWHRQYHMLVVIADPVHIHHDVAIEPVLAETQWIFSWPDFGLCMCAEIVLNLKLDFLYGHANSTVWYWVKQLHEFLSFFTVYILVYLFICLPPAPSRLLHHCVPKPAARYHQAKAAHGGTSYTHTAADGFGCGQGQV